MKNKKSCSAGVHERAGKCSGPLNEISGRVLMWAVVLVLIFGLSGGVSAIMITEFSDEYENPLVGDVELTFPGESFKTVYVKVPNGAYVSNANIKITGLASSNIYPTLPGLFVDSEVPVICSWEDFGKCVISDDDPFDLASCVLDCAQKACSVDETSYVWKYAYSEYPENKIVKGFGEFSDEKSMGWIKTYLKADKTLTANKLGLYVSEIHGDPYNLDITATISICSTTSDPETVDIEDASCSGSIVIDSIDISEAFGKTTGWKYLDLDNSFDFVAGEWYIIKIDEVVISNGDNIRDEYVIGAIETRHKEYASEGFDENFDTISKNYYSLSASLGEFDTYVILDLSDEFNEYLEDCGETDDCLIPLKFYSESAGIINLEINVITGTEQDPEVIPVTIPEIDVQSKGDGCGSVGYVEVVEVSPVSQEYPAGVIVFPEDKLCGEFAPPVTGTHFDADAEFEHALRTQIDNYVVSLLGAEIVGSGIEDTDSTDSAEVMLIADQETKWDFEADIAADRNNIRTMIADKWHSNTLKIMDKLCYKWHEDPETDGTSFNFDPAQEIQFSGRVVTSIDHVSFDRNEECGDVEVQSQWLGVDYFIEEVSYPSYTLTIDGASPAVAEKYDNLTSYYYHESLKDMVIYIQAVMDNYEKPLEEARVNGLSDYYYDHSLNHDEHGYNRPSETIYEDLRSLATVVSLAEVVKAYEVPIPQSPVDPNEYNSIGSFDESELFVGYDINGVEFFPEEFGVKASLSLVNPDYLYYCDLFASTSEMEDALNDRNLTQLNYEFNKHGYHIPPDAEITEQEEGWIIESKNKKLKIKVPYTPPEPVKIVPKIKPGDPVPIVPPIFHPPDPPEGEDPPKLGTKITITPDYNKIVKKIAKKLAEKAKAKAKAKGAKIGAKMGAKIVNKIGAIDFSTITEFKNSGTTYNDVCDTDTCGLYITSVTPDSTGLTVSETSAILTVTLKGTPNLGDYAAKFDIGKGSPAEMTEDTNNPGTYEGTYEVSCEDLGTHTITGYLTDGTYTVDEVAETTVTVIDGGCPAGNVYIEDFDCWLFPAAQAGQVTMITCTLDGTPGSTVAFNFDPMVSGTLTETQSGTYTGTYTFTPDCSDVGEHLGTITLSKGTGTTYATTEPLVVGEGSCSLSCGDGNCDDYETCSGCPADCGTCTECADKIDNDGDGKIDYPEDTGCDNSADDDESNCGDGACEGGETCDICPADCGVCCDNTIACWHFDVINPEDTTPDDSGNGNDGTVNGATLDTINFVSGSALSFDGSDDYVDIGNSLFSTTNAFEPYSITAWIKTTGNDNFKTIISQYSDPLSSHRFGVYVTDGGTVSYKKGATDDIAKSTLSVNDGLWHHVAFTRDSSKNIKLYIDGNLDGTGTDPTYFETATTKIGIFKPGTGPFNGIIDEVRIYDYALDGNEIRNHYCAVRPDDPLCHETICLTYSGWSHSKPIEIDNNLESSEELTNYQILVELNSTNFNEEFSILDPDGDDIRFTDSDCNPLDYWIEKVDTAEEQAKIWVEVPSIPAGSTTSIYMYYGNSNAESESNGDATFEFFDDFEDGNLDKWDTSATAATSSVTISGDFPVTGTHTVKLVDGSNPGRATAQATFPAITENIIVEFNARIQTKAGTAAGEALRTSTIGNAGASNIMINDNSDKMYSYSTDGTQSYHYGINLGTWYAVSIDTLVSTNKQTIRVDGVTQITNKGFSSAGVNYINLMSITYADNAPTGIAYYDTIKVRKYTPQEPSVSVGSEQAS
ncbi:hypothetical protein BEH94_00960 [Candidatus Altiarchaeales archaeon WOR_SM1_SCG]|nr:hypothetical protein BEH94_00960 [Candidatus Altiarchaeales archaeon WOR_SM1_SCG]